MKLILPDLRATAWTIEKGVVTEVNIEGVVFYIKDPIKAADVKPNKPDKPKIQFSTKKTYRKKPRAIETWILENNITEFAPNDFLKTVKQYPICKLNLTLSALIKENKIIQWKNNLFRVSSKFKQLVDSDIKNGIGMDKRKQLLDPGE